MTPVVLIGADHLHGTPFSLSGDFGLFVVVAGFAYAARALFGIPAFFLFRAYRWTSVFVYVLVGALIGLLVSIIINHPVSFDVPSLEYRGWCAAAGALSALQFRVLSAVKFDHVSRAPAHGET
jgi:tetrahydromethanopterin S-methyltransferase subunit C